MRGFKKSELPMGCLCDIRSVSQPAGMTRGSKSMGEEEEFVATALDASDACVCNFRSNLEGLWEL